MNTTEKYLSIIGVTVNSSADEIKKAYREKAKIFHPDRNKNANAHEQFILLNEAYEYLIDLKSGKQNKKQTSECDAAWQQQQREQAKARAREFARMRYEEFIASDYYKSLSSITTVTDYLYAIFMIAVFIALPIIVTINFGTTGFLISMLIVIAIIPFAYKIIRSSPPINFKNFFDALSHLIQTKTFLAVVISLFNIIVFFKIGLNTLISLSLLVSLIGLFSLIVWGVFKWKFLTQNKFAQYFYSLCVVPFVFSLLLCVNFVFSSNPTTETYHFEKEIENNKENTFIHLDGDVFDEFAGIRIFSNYDQMRNSNNINYTFETGILGLRVMKGFEFIDNDK